MNPKQDSTLKVVNLSDEAGNPTTATIGPMPPDDVNTNGEKESCSTTLYSCSFLLLILFVTLS